MNRRVYKYRGDESGVMKVPDGRVVHIAAQHPYDSLPTVWVEIDDDTIDDDTIDERILVIVGTGHPIPDDIGPHVGSAVCLNGALVWHIYDAHPPVGVS